MKNNVYVHISLTLLGIMAGGIVIAWLIFSNQPLEIFPALSVQKITELKKETARVAVLNFGDIMLDRSVKAALTRGLNPFEKVVSPDGDWFWPADLVAANLEGPISDYRPCPDKSIKFTFDPSTAGLLARSSFDLLNLANNHIYDCTSQAIRDTEKHLADNGLSFFGSPLSGGQYTIKEVSGKKILFFGINMFGFETRRLDEVYDTIAALDKINDYTIVHIHWGDDYVPKPTTEQVQIAHTLIDSGADAIIGHHPHVVQPVEIYNYRPIFYSLGNFVFDQPWPDTKVGIGAGLIFGDPEMLVNIFPYNIVSYQPTLMSQSNAIEFCNKLLTDLVERDGCSFKIRFH